MEKLRMVLVAVLVMCLFGSQSLFGGVNVASVADGSWNSDIWSSSIGGTMVPGLRPQAGDTPGLGSTVTMDADTPTFLQFIGVGVYSGSRGKLYTAGYDITIAGDAGVGFVGSANGRYNEYYIEAGTNFTVNTGYFGLAIGSNNSTKCYFTQSGGVVSQLDSSSKLLMTLSPNLRGVYTLNDGVLNIAGSLEKGSGNASFNWNGGVLNVAESQMSLSNGGTGSLSPGGIGIVGSTEFSLDTSYTQGATAIYQVDIAGASSFDSTLFTGTNGTGTATLAGAIDISLLGYTPSAGATFDIMTAPSILDNGLTLTGDTTNFSYSIVDLGTTEALRLEYVPEPATMILFGLGGMVVLNRKKR